MRLKSNTSTPKEKRSKKIMLGFAGLASAAVVSAAGFAGAAPMGNQSNAGYGGDTNVEANTSVDVDVNGNNNVIHVIVNYFFG